MEQGLNEVQGMLGRLKENLADLVSSFEETVDEQAEKLASERRKELREMLKTEQDNANNQFKTIKLETEERIKKIGRSTRKTAQVIRCVHHANLKAIAHIQKLKNGGEFGNTPRETLDHDTAGLSSCSEFQPIEMSDAVSTVLPRCGTCGKESVWLYFCAACKVTRYCDETCQMEDWKNHKETCFGL